MSPNYLRYAEALATDLEVASQPVSAKVVRRLLEERAELLAACEAMADALRSNGQVRLGFDADKSIPIDRKCVHERKQRDPRRPDNRAA
jgi:hypothetical protein